MSLLDSPKPWKSGEPLESRVHRIRDEEEPEMSNDERRAKILNVISTSPVAVMKGFEIAKAAGMECDAEFARDLNCLKSAGSIEGLRGKGWKLAGRVAKKPTLNFTLASRLETLIGNNEGEMLSPSKLANLAKADLASTLLALDYLRRDAKSVIALPSGFYVLTPSQPEPESDAHRFPETVANYRPAQPQQQQREAAAPREQPTKEKHVAEGSARFAIDDQGQVAIEEGWREHEARRIGDRAVPSLHR